MGRETASQSTARAARRGEPPFPMAGLADVADYDACRALIRVGSRSFHAASRLLPARVRGPAFALYAFCRVADDEIDEAGGRAAAIAHLRARLADAYAGAPQDTAVDRAFADMVRAFDLPRALPEALLEGLAWDAEGRRYRTLSGLSRYAARVAGSVGAMMCVLMGRRDGETLARACDLGVAMQLTNIARDVGEDARAGRLYLPETWLSEAGLAPMEFLANPQFGPPVASVIARLLAEAQTLYVRSESGVARLPKDCRAAILAARLIYAEIGAEVAAMGYDSVTCRAVTSTSRKAALLVQAFARAPFLQPAPSQDALAETQFLITETALAPDDAPQARETADTGIEWILDLYADLERRDRGLAHSRPALRRLAQA